MASQLFAKKSLKLLLEEMAGEHRLRRVLGPIHLTSLGVGAIIGAGIFVATGAAAHNVAGPALMLSYVVAGLTCVFAALCYAEFASMAPVAGSAYTYAYATLGELFAWIIGWDLVLEYAVGSATVATGWSGYFQNVLQKLGVQLPLALRESPLRYDAGAGAFVSTGSLFNLPAVVVVAVVTLILVKGIRESASFNAAMVMVKVAAVLFVIGVGMFFIDPANWRPFAPMGWTGLNFFGMHVSGQTDPGGSPIGMLAGFLPIDALLHLTNIGTLLAFVIVCAAVLIMRRTNPDADRPFRAPLVPLTPILGIGSCLLLMFSLPAANWWRLGAWLLVGLGIYFLYGRHHSIMSRSLAHEITRHGVSPGGSLVSHTGAPPDDLDRKD